MNPPVISKPYRKPIGKYIPRTKATAELHRLEQVRQEAIMAAAAELQKVLEFDDKWREAVPEALLSVLESFDRKAAYLAAQSFIAKNAEIGSELQAFGKRYAFAPVAVGEKWGIGRAYENEPGYTLMKACGPFRTYEVAIQIADKMNLSAGVPQIQAALIIASSMRAQNLNGGSK